MDLLTKVGEFRESDLAVVVEGYGKSFAMINWTDLPKARVVFIESRLNGDSIRMALRHAECAVCQIISVA